MRLNENIAFAKSILNKKEITNDSEEYKDYLKIRELCGVNTGYVGILTRIRFIDEITDMDEIASIFEILKNSKIEVQKLNKMTYDDILSQFYDQLIQKEDNGNFELIYKDDNFSYYEVYTYEGILEVGSPAWCLKTKANWNQYKEKYGRQFVVIANKYKKNIITPNNNPGFLKIYSNTEKPYIRYGISLKVNENGSVTWTACNDNNSLCVYKASSWTFFGVMSTILNLIGGHKESYYNRFLYTSPVGESGYRLVVNRNGFFQRMNLDQSKFFKHNPNDGDLIYVNFSPLYNYPPFCIVMNDFFPHTFEFDERLDIRWSNLTGKFSKAIVDDFAIKSDSMLYSGIKLEKGLITLDEIKESKKWTYLTQVDKWLVFKTKVLYVAVNTKNSGAYQLQTYSINSSNFRMPNPMFFYIEKEKMTVRGIQKGQEMDFHREVIYAINEISELEDIKNKNNTKNEPENNTKPESKIRSFFGFKKK